METLQLLQTGQLKGIRRLNLAAGLTDVPPEVFDLADSLEVLDLSNNHLQALPAEFECLQKLQIVFLSHNEFEELPTVLSRCPQLSMIGLKSNRIKTIAAHALPASVRWLILTDNQITQLPSSFGQLHQLQKLMLAGNQLRSLPESMAACQKLELIRIAANQLTDLPEWLFTLPRLAWLAYSGNPLGAAGLGERRSLAAIDWGDLELHETLGEGASGVIAKATWQNQQTRSSVQVAVKLFKGEVTSDGLPMDEMQTCIAAGSHPNLVNLLGKVINHPDGKAGLVFALIPANYKNLGHPPSLETCTRDTYPPATSFPPAVIWRIARSIAAVAAHLHAGQIMHGDLYAHNILWNGLGDCLMGDFGAASFYPPHALHLHRSLEALEVRAFGCLLEDLLDRLDTAGPDVNCDRLRSLQQDCLHSVPSLRPTFAQILDEVMA